MKKIALYRIAIVLFAALSLVSTANAGWFSSDDKPKSETQQPAATGQKGAMPQADQVILSGTINKKSQLVDDQGKVFKLADAGDGRELKSMIGKKVQVTGTLMEDSGQKVIKVSEYKVLNE